MRNYVKFCFLLLLLLFLSLTSVQGDVDVNAPAVVGGATAGAAAGAYAGGPIGSLVGAIIGGLAGLFGGRKEKIVHVPAPAPPPEIITKYETKYVNVTQKSCFDTAGEKCLVYQPVCEECFITCLAGAREYCQIREQRGIRSRRSVPVGPPLPTRGETHEPRPEEVLECFPKIMEMFDTDRNGQLDSYEMKEMDAYDPEDVLLIAFDTNGDHQVDLNEWMKGAMIATRKPHRRANLRSAFVLLDTNEDGFLSLPELVVVFSEFAV